MLIQQSASPVTFDQASTVTLAITHPTNSSLNQSFGQQIIPRSTATNLFLIGSAWGPSGRGIVELHRTRLDTARAAGAVDSSEAVLGSAMAVLSATWITQTDRATQVGDRLAGTNTTVHHRVGIAGYNGASYVDLPGNLVGVTSQSAETAKEDVAFFSSGMHASIFESTAVQQTTTVSAVSTVKLIDLAVSPYNARIYDARSSNFQASVKPNLDASCSSQLSRFTSLVNSGYRLILPTRCNLAENTWSGVGYFQLSSSAIGAIISGGLAGGFGTSSQSSTPLVTNTLSNSITPNLATVSTGSAFGEPIDMAKGHYLYEHDDFSVGVDKFPYGLDLKRFYSSGLSTQDGTLGKGWTHNLAISAAVGSDGMQALGEDSALDAAATVVELMVSQDLLSDPTTPIDKVVIATLAQRWFGDQLVKNTILVRNGLNGEVFVKLPDGSYNSPPGNAARLTKNVDATYGYEALHKARIDFNAKGQIAKYSLPNGVQANFTYSGNNLTTVANSLGRQLTFTTPSGRLTKVSDGTRSVSYSVDAATGNLTRFTDTLGKSTTLAYDLPGRLTKLFYPSNPSLPMMTNVYDSLGRVQSQANAFGDVYSYYFAGSRSEEVAPGGSSNVSYVDALGNVLERIDALGQVTLNVYDGQSRLAKTVFPELDSIEYDYDDAPCAAQQRCTHNVKTVRRIAKPGSGQSTLSRGFTYESAFNYVNRATDPLGHASDFTYTAQGDPATVTLPADIAGVRPTTTYAYTAYTRSGFPTFYLPTGVARTIDATRSTTTTTSYSTANAHVPQQTVVDAGAGALNLTTTWTYDAAGNLTRVDGPRSDVADITNFSYDSERRLTQIADAKSKLTRFGYDADGRRTRSSSQVGTQWLVSCRSYTTSGKPLRAWGPALTAADSTCPSAAAPVGVTDFAYDDLDRVQDVTENLTTAEGGNRVSRTEYWPDGKMKTQRRAVGTPLAQAEASYTYTANGRMATLTDANGNVTTYEYDGLDRGATTRYSSPSTPGSSSTTDYEQYGYDADGNLTTLRTRSGQSIVIGYDNLDRVTSRNYASGADNLTFGYDLLHRPASANRADDSYAVGYAWDNAGRLTATNAGGRTLAYQYDAAGNRTRVTWPEATPFYVTTGYDELNRPTLIKELGTTTLAQYAYDDPSRRVSVSRGNATATSYGYDNQGMLQSLGHDFAGSGQDVTFGYTRNQAQAIVTRSWNNDLYGWSGTQDTREFTVNGLNQYTAVNGTPFGYDGHGNLTADGTWSYSYDADNRLRSASASGTAATLAWDAAGRLRQTTINGATTNLLYDGERLVAEYDASGTLLRRYVHGPGIDEPLVKYEGTGTTNKSWYYADHLGSIIASADASGTSNASITYGPFGELGATTPGRFGYTGQQYLAQLGLYHYKSRFYSPTLGRFLQTDPIGVDGGINLYAYAGSDPINNRDPSGLDTRITIGYTHTIAPGAYHQVVVLTDTITGRQIATRAGPATQSIVGSSSEGWGTIAAQTGAFGSTFQDPPASIVQYQEVGTIARDFSDSVQNAIDFRDVTNQNGLLYSPVGPNSNSYATTFVESLTGTRPMPILPAPGYQMGIPDPSLSYIPSQLIGGSGVSGQTGNGGK